MAKKKRIFYPVVFMIVITIVFTLILAFINEATKETIAQQQELVTQKSILYVFNIDVSQLSDQEIQDEFKKHIQVETVDGRNIYMYDDLGYAYQFYGDGLWGSIVGHVAFDRSYTTLLGVNFTSHSETPGLGGRIDEEVFKVQFRTLDILDPAIVLNKDTGGNVDAISGATLTSKAVQDILNEFVPTIIEFGKKEGFYEGN